MVDDYTSSLQGYLDRLMDGIYEIAKLSYRGEDNNGSILKRIRECKKVIAEFEEFIANSA
jgi:Mg2+ and Co2+ transporter CorA